jgi:HAD superfamily hydrolase (TIGR01662 family)
VTILPVRGVLFDFHETLISADRWFAMEIGTIAVEMLQHLGVWSGEPSAEDRRRVEAAYARVRAVITGAAIEYSAQAIARAGLRAIGSDGQVTDRELTDAADRLFQSYLDDVTLKPHTAETLSSLAEAGYRLGILSNIAHAPFITWVLEAHRLRHHFGHITASSDFGLRKPRQEIFAHALASMGLAPAETVYVGNDYVKDIIGAKLAGLRAIWVPDAAGQDYREDTHVHPDAVVAHLDEIPAVLRAWAAEARTDAAGRGGWSAPRS